jgi:hypothetical protein
MAETIHNSNRRYGECLGSVGISTLVDRSTRHLLQTQPTKKKLAVLNRLFIFVSPTLQRPHKSISEKVKPFGWLAQSLRLPSKQLITAEEFCAPLVFYNRFRSFNTSCPVSKRFTLPMGPGYISGALKKATSLSRVKRFGG